VIAGRRISIPPTLLASAIGVIEDARLAVTLERRPSDRVIVVVGETRAELGASEWAAARGATGVSVPRCRPAEWAARYRAVSEAIRGGLAGGAHAIGRGGLLPALFYLARAAGSGVRIDLRDVPVAGAPGWEALLFGESCGRFLLTVGENDAAELLDALEGHSAAVIGTFAGERLELLLDGRAIVDAPVEELALAWRAEERP